MTTEKQAEANRRNAQASTGPRTVEGKSIASMNALKHGLTAIDWPFPTEDKDKDALLCERVIAGLEPQGPLEEELAREIANLTRRLRLAESLETGLFAYGVSAADEEFFKEKRKQFEVTEGDVRKYQLAQAGYVLDHILEISNQDTHDFFSDLIYEAASVRRTDEARLAAAFIEDAAGPNALAKFSRYETSIFNRRNKLLEQLRTLQAARLNPKGGETT